RHYYLPNLLRGISSFPKILESTRFSIFIGKKTRHYNSSRHHSQENDTTLVTAFFATGTGKHTPDEYTEWMENLLGQGETPVVIFTQPEFQELMSTARDGRPTEFRIYEEIWSVPWLHEPHFLNKSYQEMHDLDPEKDNLTPELYAVWNSKPWFLQTVSQLNPFNSTYFYWMDVGSVREAGIVLNNFPSLERSSQVFGEDAR
ncbi:Protein HtrL, partial [Folsomia candida]